MADTVLTVDHLAVHIFFHNKGLEELQKVFFLIIKIHGYIYCMPVDFPDLHLFQFSCDEQLSINLTLASTQLPWEKVSTLHIINCNSFAFRDLKRRHPQQLYKGIAKKRVQWVPASD